MECYSDVSFCNTFYKNTSLPIVLDEVDNAWTVKEDVIGVFGVHFFYTFTTYKHRGVFPKNSPLYSKVRLVLPLL